MQESVARVAFNGSESNHLSRIWKVIISWILEVVLVYMDLEGGHGVHTWILEVFILYEDLEGGHIIL